jgi:hypothetical protein
MVPADDEAEPVGKIGLFDETKCVSGVVRPAHIAELASQVRHHHGCLERVVVH